MPVDDPRFELKRIIELYHEHHIPKMAYEWASGALETTESIFDTIEEMEINGADAPTSAQEEALANICSAACRWLKD